MDSQWQSICFLLEKTLSVKWQANRKFVSSRTMDNKKIAAIKKEGLSNVFLCKNTEAKAKKHRFIYI